VFSIFQVDDMSGDDVVYECGADTDDNDDASDADEDDGNDDDSDIDVQGDVAC